MNLLCYSFGDRPSKIDYYLKSLIGELYTTHECHLLIRHYTFAHSQKCTENILTVTNKLLGRVIE